MNKLSLVLLLATATAYADPGFDQLRQSFAPMIQSATAQFNKSAVMKPVPLKKGTELTKQDCDALADKIKANYKIDPFNFIYKGGSTTSSMCGGRWGWEKNYTQSLSGKSNLGLPYTLVIQLEERSDWGTRNILSNYFVDSSNRVVEIQTLLTVPETGELFSYDIRSMDANGNVYQSQYDKNYSISGGLAQNVSGVHNIERYIPADGSVPFPLLRNTVKNSADPSKDYQILLFERADQKDWQDFQLPLTFAWDGGFYNYGGDYYSNYDKPTYKSELTIKLRGGKEYCATGNIKEDQKWTQYPADNTSYYNCVNY